MIEWLGFLFELFVNSGVEILDAIWRNLPNKKQK